MATASLPFVSLADYLRLEAEATSKSEWIDGQVIGKAGGTGTHSLLTANATGELNICLRGTACRVYNSDMMIRTGPEGIHTYADVVAVCGHSQFAEGDRILLNPTVIVEVLSKSTENYDRGEKFVHYRSIPSFQDYLLISQTAPLVEHHHKESPGVWTMREYRGLEQTIFIPAVESGLKMSEIYRGFPAGTEEA